MANESTNSQDKKVLIIEDDKDFLWILRQSFEAAGLTVIYAQDGEEGLQKAQSENPALLLVDIGLPKMDGIAVAKALRGKGVEAPIIFLTNMKDMDHISEALEAGGGGADYIVKSDVQIDAIVDRVKNKLGMQ